MRDALRCEDEVSRPRLDPPTADEEGDLARDHVERLVLAVVDVKGRGPAAAVPAEELEQAPIRLLRSDLARVAADLWLVRPPDVDHTAVLVQQETRVELFLRLRHRRLLRVADLRGRN